jgi:hypothetical protein
VSASTFDGESSFASAYVDRTQFAFGDEGSFEFRTRQVTATVVMFQFYSSQGQGQASDHIEFRLYQGQLQVLASFDGGTFLGGWRRGTGREKRGQGEQTKGERVRRNFQNWVGHGGQSRGRGKTDGDGEGKEGGEGEGEIEGERDSEVEGKTEKRGRQMSESGDREREGKTERWGTEEGKLASRRGNGEY